MNDLHKSVIPKVFSPTAYLRQTDSGLFQRQSRWKVSFFGFGALALLWLPPWLLQAPSGRLERMDGWTDQLYFFGGGMWLGDSFGSFKVKQKLLNSIILKGIFSKKPQFWGTFGYEELLFHNHPQPV